MSIYENIYNLMNEYVYGNTIVEGSFEELVAILFSTGACLFMVALPFLVVWKVLTFIIERF